MSILTGEKQGRDASVGLRQNPNALLGHGVCAEQTEAAIQGKVILCGVALWHIAPVTTYMPIQIVAGVDAILFQVLKHGGSGNDLPQCE